MNKNKWIVLRFVLRHIQSKRCHGWILFIQEAMTIQSCSFHRSKVGWNFMALSSDLWFTWNRRFPRAMFQEQRIKLRNTCLLFQLHLGLWNNGEYQIEESSSAFFCGWATRATSDVTLLARLFYLMASSRTCDRFFLDLANRRRAPLPSVIWQPVIPIWRNSLKVRVFIGSVGWKSWRHLLRRGFFLAISNLLMAK